MAVYSNYKITISIILMVVNFEGWAQTSANIKSFDVEKAKASVTNNFKDPESAKFRKMYISKFVNNEGESAYSLCGEVNAKNSMGGYVGYKNFVALENSSALIDLEIDSSSDSMDAFRQKMFEMSYPRLCANRTKEIGK